MTHIEAQPKPFKLWAWNLEYTLLVWSGNAVWDTFLKIPFQNSIPKGLKRGVVFYEYFYDTEDVTDVKICVRILLIKQRKGVLSFSEIPLDMGENMGWKPCTCTSKSCCVATTKIEVLNFVWKQRNVHFAKFQKSIWERWKMKNKMFTKGSITHKIKV